GRRIRCTRWRTERKGIAGADSVAASRAVVAVPSRTHPSSAASASAERLPFAGRLAPRPAVRGAARDRVPAPLLFALPGRRAACAVRGSLSGPLQVIDTPLPQKDLSAGLVVVHHDGSRLRLLCLRTFDSWDFPKTPVPDESGALQAAF